MEQNRFASFSGEGKMAQITFTHRTRPQRVHTIFCIGRNYAAHAAELNNPVPSAPIIFIKPASAIVHDGGEIVLPPQSRDVHFETEVVVAIGKRGRDIQPDDAARFIYGYGIGIDVTARDIQQRAKEKGQPWTVAKGFDTFAPVSTFVPSREVADPQNLTLRLYINDKLRQQGNTREMIFPIPRLISYLSTIFTLSPGDLIFTGTPEGVGKLSPGDQLTALLGDRRAVLHIRVRERTE